MFHACPVKISKTEPSSRPSCLRGNRATIASITPGRKLSTGIDCRISSKGSKTRAARSDFAAAKPYASANSSDRTYAIAMRTSEYAAYSGSARGLDEMCATGVNGANQMRPETNNAYRIARIPAKTEISATNELSHRVRSVIARRIVWWWMGEAIFMCGGAVRGESRLGPNQPFFYGIII